LKKERNINIRIMLLIREIITKPYRRKIKIEKEIKIPIKSK
jgi:hypothetical protein